MKTGFKPDHVVLRGSSVKHTDEGRLGVVGPPRVRQPFDVVHRVLRLTSDAHGLVLGHVPRVLRIHGDGAVLVDHLDVDAVRLDVGELDLKRRRRGGAVIVGANRRERLQPLNV